MLKCMHHEDRVLCLHFERDMDIQKAVKKFPTYLWSQMQMMKCWYRPNTTPHFRLVLEKLRPLGYVDFSEVIKKAERIPSENTHIPKIAPKITPSTQLYEPVRHSVEKFSSWLIPKRYRANTINPDYSLGRKSYS